MTEKNNILDIKTQDMPDFSTSAGQKNTPPICPTEKQVINALKTVEDPDIGIDIYNLGLIYRIDIDQSGDVKIEMTLTSPTCPYAEKLVHDSAHAVAELDEAGEVFVKLIWDPIWTLDRLSEEARYELDLL
ncbi:MAG: DUF59 domain-containing protein [Alphaproteobacteria bacterium]|nr:DUF59 domain-containing protein [Alphaproteobacteria bacterium]MBN2779442.1 DUF59 domain-containing protein [Alphaproteobacteria bacterium]